MCFDTLLVKGQIDLRTIVREDAGLQTLGRITSYVMTVANDRSGTLILYRPDGLLLGVSASDIVDQSFYLLSSHS